ncbi:MAG TPA: hypothetical protein VGG14_17870 [Candidatus Sulfotelmatobacter sp.]|jgi:hypothetical protein
MEALTRLVSDSLARHGFNRPPDPRRLQWSRWVLCDSLHSLLVVPSKPGIFAIAEEICETSAAEAPVSRMLAVLQFSEDDDMAFVLDRMFTRPNPMRERLASGHCFLRFVVIEDEDQRRSICNALNQWLISSAEKASGIPAGFSSSLEWASVERASGPVSVMSTTDHAAKVDAAVDPTPMDSGCNANRHCAQPLPSGF